MDSPGRHVVAAFVGARGLEACRPPGSRAGEPADALFVPICPANGTNADPGPASEESSKKYEARFARGAVGPGGGG